jgi:hypothetical protein
MTEVEALLAVDRGKVPADTVAFFARDPDATERSTYLTLAGVAALVAVASTFGHAARPLIAVMLIAATALIVLSFPTLGGQEDDGHKRYVLLVTPKGIIVRDSWGLRTWLFDELIEALPWSYEHRPHLVLVERDGTRHAVDYLGFTRGERLREMLVERLKGAGGVSAG